MTQWNYRVFRGEEDGEVWYDIREVHYAQDGTAGGWTINRMRPGGESVDELRRDLAKMRDAFLKPVLEEGEDGTLVEYF